MAGPGQPAAPAAPSARRKGATPFASAAGAWLWAASMLTARRDGADARFGTGGIRPCEPDDVLKVVDRLYRQRRITLAHAKALRVGGDLQRAPDPARPGERENARLWREAITAMEAPLRMKGIVA